MSSPENMLREAVAAYQGGRLAEARTGYERVLRAQPGNHLALSGLALLSFQAGAKDEAIDYVLRALKFQPDIAPTWRWLGTLYLETGRPMEGKAAFQRVTELTPGSCEAWYDLAACVQREGDLDTAAQLLRRALTCPQPLGRASEALANLLCRQGRLAEAEQTVADWLRREPSDAVARHLAAALSGRSSPERASDEYVRTYFDAFANDFDSVLKTLNYQGPELVVTALRAVMARESTPVLGVLLDAGCGTGLCGAHARALCTTLIGVDLSPRMLHKAEQRGCYDELVAQELGAFMLSRPQAFDAILCADTFIYFGDLATPLAAARTALRAGSHLVFTVESLPPLDSADHKLDVSGRYRHSEDYLRGVLKDSGFSTESIVAQSARQDAGREVAGYVVVARTVAQE